MSVAVRPFRNKPGKWQVDIIFHTPDGTRVRDQRVHSAKTEGMAKRWGEARESQLRAGTLTVKKDEAAIPTWDEFFPRFMDHSTGEHEKESSLATKRSAHRVWLSPTFGKLPLDQISDERLSKLRSTMRKSPGRKTGTTLSPKTINQSMTVLGAALKLAVRWKVIPAMPCTVEIPVVHSERPEFYDFEDYDRLAGAAAKVGTREAVVVRLGGDAGLRRGEMMALRWTDVDLRRRQIRVEQAAWVRSAKAAKAEGAEQWNIAKPKGGRGRIVPMTDALATALQAHRHLRGDYVLCLEGGSPAPGHIIRDWLEAAQRRAGLTVLGALHKLRHTFCSHLAMKGAPVKAIQELAGHSSLSTTLRYMHLSPSTLDAAIALLNGTTGASR
ncbi:MAG TPA: site-specific integrase [Polyangiaceae bacterium]|jgi:integrase